MPSSQMGKLRFEGGGPHPGSQWHIWMLEPNYLTAKPLAVTTGVLSPSDTTSQEVWCGTTAEDPARREELLQAVFFPSSPAPPSLKVCVVLVLGGKAWSAGTHVYIQLLQIDTPTYRLYTCVYAWGVKYLSIKHMTIWTHTYYIYSHIHMIYIHTRIYIKQTFTPCTAYIQTKLKERTPDSYRNTTWMISMWKYHSQNSQARCEA